ncbi:hypothetical protein DFH08DRAFT_705168, partial [Mycena albidolilacea]
SHITTYKAKHLLKHKPNGVVPNSLNVVKFQTMHEFQNCHTSTSLSAVISMATTTLTWITCSM